MAGMMARNIGNKSQNVWGTNQATGGQPTHLEVVDTSSKVDGGLHHFLDPGVAPPTTGERLPIAGGCRVA